MTLSPVAAGTPPAVPGPGPVRPPLVRPDEGRVIAGVAAGVAAHLGWTVRQVRVAFVVLALLNGAGLGLYLWLWALVPTREVGPSLSGPAAVAADEARRIRRLAAGDLVAGALLLAGGAIVALTQAGWHPVGSAALALIPIVGGAALVYSQLDDVESTSWRTDARARRAIGFRVIAGLVLVLAGIGLGAIDLLGVGDAAGLVVAVTAMIGGTVLVLAPWGIRLVRRLSAEQEARAAEQVRADIAAHLHDSVLQTLALIQRASSDQAQVVRLARRQERDLRTWLYGGGPSSDTTLAAAVRAAVDDVEERHAVTVDLVVVGDRAIDARGEALVAALREAMVNAAKHAGGSMAVYVESTDDGVEASVKDRGRGFDVADLPPDRHGVRQSIVARMERHRGTAEIRSAPGEGTEVRLVMPAEVEEEDT